MEDYHARYDFDCDDDRSTCPECGKPMSSDLDGDGVMTMSYEFCEDCGTKDYGEPVRLTEQIIARMREEEEATRKATQSTTALHGSPQPGVRPDPSDNPFFAS